MNNSKLDRLRRIEIPTKCHEDWDAMEGGEAKRFCSGCNCFVHNLSAMKANDAEQVLNTPSRICAGITVDADRGVLTKDGWIPRLLLAGTIAASVTGCSQQQFQGEAMGTPVTQVVKSPANEEPTIGKVAASKVQAFMGDVALPQQKLGQITKSVKNTKRKTTK